jgi:hypothetical protein
MDKQEQIRQRIKKFASDVGPKGTVLGKVTNLRESELLFDLEDDNSGLTYLDVRLRPVIDGTEGITLIPKEDTWALAVRLEDGEDWYALAFGEVDKVTVKCEQVVFNGGTKGGLVNWPDAKVQLDKTNDVVSALLTAISSWTPVPSDGGAAFKTALTTALAGKAVGVFTGLEDTKVKH